MYMCVYVHARVRACVYACNGGACTYAQAGVRACMCEREGHDLTKWFMTSLPKQRLARAITHQIHTDDEPVALVFRLQLLDHRNFLHALFGFV